MKTIPFMQSIICSHVMGMMERVGEYRNVAFFTFTLGESHCLIQHCVRCVKGGTPRTVEYEETNLIRQIIIIHLTKNSSETFS